MSPELRKAIDERRARGYTNDQIKNELQEAGYDEATIIHLLESNEAPIPSASTSSALPPALTLLNNGIDFVKKRYDLALVLAAPMVVLSAIEYLNAVYDNTSLAMASVLVYAVTLITYFLVMVSVIYIVCHDAEKEVSFQEAMAWSRRHIFAYLWLAILSGLVVWGGFLLFIIPGIALSLYLFLTQYTFVLEDKRGFDALNRSFNLVRGNWWTLLGRLLVIGIIIMLLFVVFGSLVALSASAVPESLETTFLGNALANLASGFLAVINIAIGVQIYRSLSARAQSEPAQHHNVVFGILLGLGVLALASVIAISIYGLTTMDSWQSEEFESLPIELEEAMRADGGMDAKERAEALRTEGEQVIP
jgi:hypothetical protein